MTTRTLRGLGACWLLAALAAPQRSSFAEGAPAGGDRGGERPLVRIGTVQPRNRTIDHKLEPAEALAQVERSLDALERLVERAGEARCDAVAFPEDTLGLLKWLEANPEPLKELLPRAVRRMLERLGAAAARHRMYLVCCNDTLDPDGALRNTAFLLGRDGKEIGRYHKVQPVIHEARKRGDRFPVFQTPDLGAVGLLICYDMVFPEAPRCLALAGADVIFHPTLGGAAIGDDDISLAAFRTRAVENFVYLVVSQRGGGSMVISPRGKVLAQGREPDDIVTADIDPRGGREGGDAFDHQEDMRARLFRERSPAAYGILGDPAPPVLAKVPATTAPEEAARIAGKALTVGEEDFRQADALRGTGKTGEAIAAFERLRAEYRGTWIDRVARDRLEALRQPLPDASGAKGDGPTGERHGSRLPELYFQLLEAGAARVEERLAAEPGADLEALEARQGWRHFPSALLAAAVLHSKDHRSNSQRGDAGLLALARRIGDLLAGEHARGRYASRLDHHRDTYMWLEAYRLLERELGDASRARWREALLDLLGRLAADVEAKRDFPRYQSPFISTSPNHYALWASTVHLGGRVFGKEEWEHLGSHVLRRFATREQTRDGYWGEWSDEGPTTGYDYLTATGVALYHEHSGDPAALEALRRSLDFHLAFTYPDGTPVETVNDRNRHWGVSPWGHFGFSHFPDGRRYAGFLTGFLAAKDLDLESLGRLAQDALYFHEGPEAPIPQDEERFVRRLSVPAGVRKIGPWVVCLSGLIDARNASRWYLDRQGSASVFHEKLGLILTGANSKRQPELATFSEKVGEQVYHTPASSRLEVGDGADGGDRADRLALAYNSFFAVLEVPPPQAKRLELRFAVTPKGGAAERRLTLQLVLRPGGTLETGAGRKAALDGTRIDWGPEEHGGSVRHGGWSLRLPPAARLSWPVYPFNPYADGPETRLEHAVAALAVPLSDKAEEISFVLEAD
ncbi:MAG: carbon-nitrogen hydrolase family protein [Planctomycetes bacterium]|nr:carbon-nitrogen hydrolase family protein [Planctomycetota bacterium]